MAKYIIVHSGIKGMKWGLRRYQNEDGSLTAAGKVRYGIRSAGEKAGHFLGRALVGAKNIAGKVGGAAGRTATNIAKKHQPLSLMTDDDIKARISRLKLEKEYKELKRESSLINRGKEALTKGILEGTTNGIKDLIAARVKRHTEDLQSDRKAEASVRYGEIEGRAKERLKAKQKAKDNSSKEESTKKTAEPDSKAIEKARNKATKSAFGYSSSQKKALGKYVYTPSKKTVEPSTKSRFQTKIENAQNEERESRLAALREDAAEKRRKEQNR